MFTVTMALPVFKGFRYWFFFSSISAKNVVFKHGNGGAGAKDLTVSAAVGTNLIWLDSAPFVNKATGVITVETNEATASKLSMFGYEMR